jgi:hypothetical protein
VVGEPILIVQARAAARTSDFARSIGEMRSLERAASLNDAV